MKGIFLDSRWRDAKAYWCIPCWSQPSVVYEILTFTGNIATTSQRSADGLAIFRERNCATISRLARANYKTYRERERERKALAMVRATVPLVSSRRRRGYGKTWLLHIGESARRWKSRTFVSLRLRVRSITVCGGIKYRGTWRHHAIGRLQEYISIHKVVTYCGET